LYRLRALPGVPGAAAADASVSIVRARGGRGAAAFTNGVLRSVCRSIDAGRHEAARAEAGSDPVRAIAGRHSFPEFLVERYLRRFGAAECEELLEALNRPASIALRLCPRPPVAGDAIVDRLLGEGIETVPSPALAGARRVVKGAPQRTQAFRDGLIYVQDEAAQIVARLLDPLPARGALLDLCAAPGGKALAAAQNAPG